MFAARGDAQKQCQQRAVVGVAPGRLLPQSALAALEMVQVGHRVFDPEIAAEEGRRLVEQFSHAERGIQDRRHVLDDRRLYRHHDLPVRRRQVAGQGDRDRRCLIGGARSIFLAQADDHLFECGPVRHRAASAGAHQQRRAYHRFRVSAGILQIVGIHTQLSRHPDGGLHQRGRVGARGALGEVVVQAAQRPLGEQRDVLVLERSMRLHAEVAALGHGDQRLEHVRAALGARQQTVVAQGPGGQVQVAPGRMLQVQAHQVDQPVAGAFQIGTQVLGSEIPRDLYHALGCFLAHGGQLRGPDDAVAHAVLQGLLEEGPLVEQRDGLQGRLRRCGRRVHRAIGCCGWRHQIADSSSSSRAAGVLPPRSVSLVSTRVSSSTASSSSARPWSWARAWARKTSKVSVKRSGHS